MLVLLPLTAAVLFRPDVDVNRSEQRPALHAAHEAEFDRVAECESGGDWQANTGNSYYGGLQENLAFWANYGGLRFAARPDLASRAEQITVAERGLAVQGWCAWPYCRRAA